VLPTVPDSSLLDAISAETVLLLLILFCGLVQCSLVVYQYDKDALQRVGITADPRCASDLVCR
jgi:hypothetical protein